MGQGLRQYSALKGRPVANRLATGTNAHYQVQVSAANASYRIAINVQSSDGSEVEFLVRQRFEHPITALWEALPEGRTLVPRQPNTAAVDFIRGNIAQPWEFKPLPLSVTGPDNDLNEKIDAYVQRAMADEDATIYAFGEAWGPEQAADKFFGFQPGNGIHDIHMNQGNPPGPYAKDNGTYQDGALAFHYARENLWVAIFLKFQTQAWHSDDTDAEPLPDVPHQPPSRDDIPDVETPDGLIRIIAAYVNDVRSPERETVTLLNVSDREIDLTGWSLKDKQKNELKLSGPIGAGEARRIEVRGPGQPGTMQLSNQGGIITLLDPRGVKVHGVSYTRTQAQQPGRTIPFQQ